MNQFILFCSFELHMSFKIQPTKECDTCPICLEVFDKKTGNAETNCCHKMIHTNCLVQSAMTTKMTCPLCRASFHNQQQHTSQPNQIRPQTDTIMEEMICYLKNDYIPDCIGYNDAITCPNLLTIQTCNTLLTKLNMDLVSIRTPEFYIKQLTEEIGGQIFEQSRSINAVKDYTNWVLSALRQLYFDRKYKDCTLSLVFCVCCHNMASYGPETEPSLLHCAQHKRHHEINIRDIYEPYFNNGPVPHNNQHSIEQKQLSKSYPIYCIVS